MLLAILEVPEESLCSSALKSIKEIFIQLLSQGSLHSHHVAFVLDFVYPVEAAIFIKI